MKKIAVLAMTLCFLFAAGKVNAQKVKDTKQTSESNKQSKKSASDQTANTTKTPKLDSFKQRGKKENGDQAKTTAATTSKTTTTSATASATTTTATTTSDKSVGKDAQGRTIYEGPKGGRYYLNKDGKKVYVKK
jgi:colicin import membrane protein